MSYPAPAVLIRHESEVPTERSTCGMRYRLISREDKGTVVAAWVHAVDIDGAREHYHKRGTEIYYVLEGQGAIRLDGVEHPIRKGTLVHIPPGVVHGPSALCGSWSSEFRTSATTICSFRKAENRRGGQGPPDGDGGPPGRVRMRVAARKAASASPTVSN